jgi:hypothetical protein
MMSKHPLLKHNVCPADSDDLENDAAQNPHKHRTREYDFAHNL